MTNFLGLMGSILLAGCALPLAWQAIAERRMEINSAFLTCWTLGELFTIVYVWGDWILMLNYSLNCLLLIPVWYYKQFPQR